MPRTLSALENDTDNTKVLTKFSYRPDKELVLVDTLSRAFLQDDESLEEKFEVSVLSTIEMPDLQLMQLKEETKRDDQLQKLTTMITND